MLSFGDNKSPPPSPPLNFFIFFLLLFIYHALPFLLLCHPFLRSLSSPLSSFPVMDPFFSWISHLQLAVYSMFLFSWKPERHVYQYLGKLSEARKIATEQPLRDGHPFTTFHHVTNSQPPRPTPLFHPSLPIKVNNLDFALIDWNWVQGVWTCPAETPSYRGRIKWRNWDKSLKGFPPCYLQSPLLPPLPPPPPSKSGLKLGLYVNIVYGNLKSENSQDCAQKP